MLVKCPLERLDLACKGRAPPLRKRARSRADGAGCKKAARRNRPAGQLDAPRVNVTEDQGVVGLLSRHAAKALQGKQPLRTLNPPPWWGITEQLYIFLWYYRLKTPSKCPRAEAGSPARTPLPSGMHAPKMLLRRRYTSKLHLSMLLPFGPLVVDQRVWWLSWPSLHDFWLGHPSNHIPRPCTCRFRCSRSFAHSVASLRRIRVIHWG